MLRRVHYRIFPGIRVARRHSAASNYAIGQGIRILCAMVCGVILDALVLPRIGLIHTEQGITVASLGLGLFFAVLAKRHT